MNVFLFFFSQLSSILPTLVLQSEEIVEVWQVSVQSACFLVFLQKFLEFLLFRIKTNKPANL